MANYNFKDLQAVMYNWTTQSPNTGFTAQTVGEVLPEYAFHEPEPSSITCMTGNTEMLRVAKDGFYVRGVKVPADDKEAETVYNAFKQFLVWSELHRT